MTPLETPEPDETGLLRELSRIAKHIVSISVRYRFLCLSAWLVLVASALAFTVGNIEIRTDMNSLISADLPWRADAERLEKAFPDQTDDIVVVVDGATPEIAEWAAHLLSDRLQSRTDLFVDVDRLNGGDFIDQERLLYLSSDDLRDLSSSLIAAQPLIGPVTEDPTLRGLVNALSTAAASLENDPAGLDKLRAPLRQILNVSKPIETSSDNYLSWTALVSDQPSVKSPVQQFIVMLPRLDWSDSMPGNAARIAIREAFADINALPGHPVTIRITGSVPMSDDELATLAETTGPIAALMALIMVLILYFAVRSWTLVGSILVTLLSGAIVVSAFGLLTIGRFNLVSIAFLPLFLGLGVDFSIQYCVAYRTLGDSANHRHAGLIEAAAMAGGGLMLAAVATAIGFLAFLPTAYLGVKELGLIAGGGMMIALFATLTLLPALLSWLPSPLPMAKNGWSGLTIADHAIRKRAAIIVGASILACAIAITALPGLEFNFDPMRLRSPATESVSTYLELSRSVDTTPDIVSVILPDLASAKLLSLKLSKRAEIGSAETLADFVPNEQATKLAVIRDLRNLLDFTLNPFATRSSPSDAEVVSALRKGADAFEEAASRFSGDDRKLLNSMAARWLELASGTPSVRYEIEKRLMFGFPVILKQIRRSLDAESVTSETMPTRIRQKWISDTGEARIEISPAHALADMKDIKGFVAAIQPLVPNAAGDAVTVVESSKTILQAFTIAGLLSFSAISLLLVLTLRSWIATILTLLPVVLAGVWTAATCTVLGIDINLENMIALPLILGVGVAFNVYFVVAWQNGREISFTSGLSRAVLFSALTTGLSFATLGLSAHPGTASMGHLLLLALSWTLFTTFVVLPALLCLFAKQTERNV
tara:strand:+ start:24380 stop:27028 length:2649 start_codon:yes stop_codon:yes gene_type:complete